jgi:hypothetical protein
MEFANYYFIRALEQGWEILKTKDVDLWDKIFPPSVPTAERRRARNLIIKTDIQFRLTYSVGITNENTNVISTGLDGLRAIESNPMLLNVQQDGDAWVMDRGTVTIYIVTYNEFLMMTLANIVRTILSSFITDGWFVRAGFDIVRRLTSQDLRVETGNMPENVTKYIRQQTWECAMATKLPHIEGPFDWPIKPIFVADNTVECDSILDPTTGEEYDLGGTLTGGVTPEP